MNPYKTSPHNAKREVSTSLGILLTVALALLATAIHMAPVQSKPVIGKAKPVAPHHPISEPTVYAVTEQGILVNLTGKTAFTFMRPVVIESRCSLGYSQWAMEYTAQHALVRRCIMRSNQLPGGRLHLDGPSRYVIDYRMGNKPIHLTVIIRNGSYNQKPPMADTSPAQNVNILNAWPKGQAFLYSLTKHGICSTVFPRYLLPK